jgi:uncharacterized protein DUF1844
LKPAGGVRNLPAMGDSKATGGFTVTDRRSFGEGGDPRTPEEAATTPAATAGDEDAAGPRGAAGSPTLPAVDFHTFVLSLGSSALLHLGELEHPDVGAPQKDLPLAKHTIDILVMLEEKTKGNLTPAEEKLIGSLLYDLRLRYVEAQKT